MYGGWALSDHGLLVSEKDANCVLVFITAHILNSMNIH